VEGESTGGQGGGREERRHGLGKHPAMEMNFHRLPPIFPHEPLGDQRLLILREA
jgi:hypothetical protein